MRNLQLQFAPDLWIARTDDLYVHRNESLPKYRRVLTREVVWIWIFFFFLKKFTFLLCHYNNII